MKRMLSAHFSFDELTLSQTAARLGLDNHPNTAELRSLLRLAARLEQVRTLLNAPLIISSGYRSIAVNRAIGGAAFSAHVRGLAADFTAPGYGTPRAVARAIAGSDIAFDQLIFEYGRWVHIGLAPASINPRRQILSATADGIFHTGIRAA